MVSNSILAEPSSTRYFQPSAVSHFSVALVLFAFYGNQVCPFLDTLTLTQLMVPMLISFVAILGLRIQSYRHIIVKKPYKDQSRVGFNMDLLMFILAGVFLALFNWGIYNFPLESGVKIVVFMTGVGFFIAADLALLKERRLSEKLGALNIQLDPDEHFHSLSKKFSIFALVAVLLVAAVIFLVVFKDFDWLRDHINEVSLQQATWYILFEIGFVMMVILGYLLKVITTYADNMNQRLAAQNKVLAQVSQGDLSPRVPVTSNDEFAVMGKFTNTMIQSLIEKNTEIEQTRDATVIGLASLAEARDNETGNHILRTQRYVKALALSLRAAGGKWQALIDNEMVNALYQSAPLHDVGKVGIADAILLKPGKLTDDEFVIMKTHAQIGADALLKASEEMGDHSFLTVACEIAQSHHEKWDGSGYPQGLIGEAIPLSARLMALADVYDALISERVYKPAFSHEKSKGIILEGEGKHFDPDVVAAFLHCEGEFIRIAKEFND